MKFKNPFALSCAHRWQWVNKYTDGHNIYACAKCDAVKDRDWYMYGGPNELGWDGAMFAPCYPPKQSYTWLKFRIWLYQRMGWPLDEEWYEG